MRNCSAPQTRVEMALNPLSTCELTDPPHGRTRVCSWADGREHPDSVLLVCVRAVCDRGPGLDPCTLQSNAMSVCELGKVLGAC